MAADVATALPQLDLKETSVLTVTLDDPGATITRLVIHGWQTTGATSSPPSPVGGAYLPGVVA